MKILVRFDKTIGKTDSWFFLDISTDNRRIQLIKSATDVTEVEF